MLYNQNIGQDTNSSPKNWGHITPDYQLFKWQNVGAFPFLKYETTDFWAQPTGAEQPAELRYAG